MPEYGIVTVPSCQRLSSSFVGAPHMDSEGPFSFRHVRTIALCDPQISLLCNSSGLSRELVFRLREETYRTLCKLS